MFELENPLEITASSGESPAEGAEFIEKFVSFDLCGHRCLVEADGVEEVVRPLPTSQLPNQPSWLLGIAAHRGDPVAVIEPSMVFPGEETVAGSKAKTLIFRRSDGQCRFALPIDSLRQLISLRPDSLRFDGLQQPYKFFIECEIDSEKAVLISQRLLIESLIFGEH